jgi:hypothetical protein
MKINVEVGPEFKKYVEEYQERKELETFDEAFGALTLVGAKRTQALDKGTEKAEQARRFKAGEIKTPPSFETRTNRFPELVKAPEKKEPKPKKEKPAKAAKPAKESKPAKVEKAPKSTLSNKKEAAKPKAPPDKKAKAVKVVKGEESKVEAIEPEPAPKSEPVKGGDDNHAAEAKAWYAEQKSKGLIVKPTDLVRQFGWAFNRAKGFLDEQKAA